MDIDINKQPCELDTVVIVYFGQGGILIHESSDLDNLLNEYFMASSPFQQRMLLANLVEVENQEDGYEVLNERYGDDFYPEGWNLTSQEWVRLVKERTIEQLHKNGHSSELSHF